MVDKYVVVAPMKYEFSICSKFTFFAITYLCPYMSLLGDAIGGKT